MNFPNEFSVKKRSAQWGSEPIALCLRESAEWWNRGLSGLGPCVKQFVLSTTLPVRDNESVSRWLDFAIANVAKESTWFFKAFHSQQMQDWYSFKRQTSYCGWQRGEDGREVCTRFIRFWCFVCGDDYSLWHNVGLCSGSVSWRNWLSRLLTRCLRPGNGVEVFSLAFGSLGIRVTYAHRLHLRQRTTPEYRGQ